MIRRIFRNQAIPTLVMVLMILTWSCSTSRKARAPQAKAISFADSLPPLPTSEIDIPVKVFAPPILSRVEQTVSKEFTSDYWPNYVQAGCDFRYKYRFVRSPLQVSCTNNLVSVQFTGNYQIAGSRCICSGNNPVTPWISGSCGFGSEPMRRVTVQISSKLQFLPSYQVKTATGLGYLQPKDKCEVSLLSNDVTQLIMDSVQSSVKAFCTTLDNTIGGLQFKAATDLLQQKSYRKNNLEKYGYLLINPSSFRIGQLNYARDTFSISVGLSCRPELSSDSSSPIASTPLPPLSQTANRHGISLYLNGAYSYAFLSKMLNDTLRNKVFEFKGRTIVVKNVEMQGAGNHEVLVKIDFAGSNKGSISLRGRPVIDTTAQTLSIQDLSYSLESRDLALKMARALFRNKIRNSIQGKSYLDIGALVRANLPALTAQLNRRLSDNVLTTGQALDARVIALLPREDLLQFQVFVKAELTCVATGFH